MFENARWIWTAEDTGRDSYADFITTFGDVEDPVLHIACETNYTVYVNDDLAAFGQYADYPFDTVYDSIDLKPFMREGNNELKITVWYEGIHTQTNIATRAGLIFQLDADGKTVQTSGDNIFSRPNPNYVAGESRLITGQLGCTWHYDACRGWEPYTASREVEMPDMTFRPRPIKKLTLEPRTPSRVVSCGSFRYPEAEDVMARLEGVVLTPSSSPVRLDGDDGVYVIVDTGAEVSGFPEFELDVPEACRIDIGYGEHLEDGHCRMINRNFNARYDAHAGKNTYMNPFRRFGCRYLELMIHAPEADVAYLGIRPTLYPVSVLPFETSDARRKAIYDVSVNTLRQCMHEHYEDCPWREQALYTLDSRNQMLCGYFAFGEYAFARASLQLMGQGVREDGILPLCAPAGHDCPIPSYTFAYFIQMDEYIRYSHDTSLAEAYYPLLTRLMKTFSDNVGQNGLTRRFAEATPERYWNFYEWSDGLVGSIGGHSFDHDVEYDAVLNAFYSLALEHFASISRALGKEGEAYKYHEAAQFVNRALFAAFFDPEKRVFRTYADSERIHVLTNALCLLCGAADEIEHPEIVALVADNGRSSGAVAATLSMMGFRYDALLREDRERYAPHILEEIDAVWGKMLDAGATSFWETEDGAAAFGGAGSLCHGWSALPAYYYRVL